MRDAEGLGSQECFQCSKCSAGCPVVSFMDYKPHQVIQMVNLGLADQLLSCRTIWVCASCYSCSTRCPNNVDVAKVMDWLRQTALAGNTPPAERDVALFHKSFLQSIRTFGRVHELSLMALYKLAAKKYLDDLQLGWKMFARGKLRLLPARTRNRKQVAELFNKGGAT